MMGEKSCLIRQARAHYQDGLLETQASEVYALLNNCHPQIVCVRRNIGRNLIYAVAICVRLHHGHDFRGLHMVTDILEVLPKLREIDLKVCGARGVVCHGPYCTGKLHAFQPTRRFLLPICSETQAPRYRAGHTLVIPGGSMPGAQNGAGYEQIEQMIPGLDQPHGPAMPGIQLVNQIGRRDEPQP